MKPPINPQPLDKPSIRKQRFAQHSRQKRRSRVIIPIPGDLNRQLNPLAPSLALRFFFFLILPLLSRDGLIAAPGPFDFGLDAHDGFGAVGETYPCAPVGAGEDARLGNQGAELGWGAAVGADWGGEGEGGVEVGEFGGGEEDLVC